MKNSFNKISIAFVIILGISSSLSAQSKSLPKAPPPPPAAPVQPPVPPSPVGALLAPPAPEKNLKEIYLEENRVVSNPDVAAEYPGGQEAMYKYIGANLKYPAEAKSKKIQGKVIAQFIIEKDGSISDVVIIRDQVNYGAGTEVTRVIKGMPKWKPGVYNGKIARVQYTIPVNFTL